MASEVASLVMQAENLRRWKTLISLNKNTARRTYLHTHAVGEARSDFPKVGLFLVQIGS